MRWPPPPDWPMAEYSQLILHRPHRWHVQQAGTGPTILLIHGAGGATQSWRHLFPLLAQTHHVVAVDLPGQGFTQVGARQRCGVDDVAADLTALMQAQGWHPAAVVGHSAGAAMALRMADMGDLPEARIVGINAALANFKGVAGWLFPAMAKALAMTPLSATLFSATMTETGVRNLIRGTGSTLDDAGVACYLRLARDAGHVGGTLAMMAQWSLDGLLDRLPTIVHPTTLLTGDKDTAVPPQTSVDAAAQLPNARHLGLSGMGHLAHEEDAARIATEIRKALVRFDA